MSRQDDQGNGYDADDCEDCGERPRPEDQTNCSQQREDQYGNPNPEPEYVTLLRPEYRYILCSMQTLFLFGCGFGHHV